MSLEAIVWNGKDLKILDQLLLPEKSEYISVKNVEDGWNVIHKMQVRGAPAIAIVGCLSLAAELVDSSHETSEDLSKAVSDKLAHLVTARPTAVNMKKAASELSDLAQTLCADGMKPEELKKKVVDWCAQMLTDDVTTNRKIGDFGAIAIIEKSGKTKVKLLTHCNTGSLATAGYGTALGVVRSLHSKQQLDHIYCTETRPYNQGCRLTAYELVYESMPATLICDNMGAALMNSVKLDAIVVGADRVASNGDTANKIGTYQLAVAALHHDVPFYVCAPTTSIDLNLACGTEIPIEERPQQEMTHIAGVRIAAPGISCWNPGFDITPASLITGGIVTDLGVFKPSELSGKLKNQSL
ncbi:S-methyl-5-thioribose-1-phosphate isomerase [Halocaridina rubra]|uniref:Methylthioribose-1-phosphate isomerase n=1 Tax=Halocaridina rubra TaxID=373956 RepID=A0AAN9AAV9_HALRR